MLTFRVTLDGRSAGHIRCAGRKVREADLNLDDRQSAWVRVWAEGLLAAAALFDAITYRRDGSEWGLQQVRHDAPVVYNEPIYDPEPAPVIPKAKPLPPLPKPARYNPDLDAAFAEPAAVTVRPTDVMRHNPDLEAVFGA